MKQTPFYKLPPPLQNQSKSSQNASNFPPNPNKSNMIPPSKYPFAETNEENFDEEFSILQSLWDDLGASKEYQRSFERFLRELSENDRRLLLSNEKASLKRLLDALNKLTKEIMARGKNISKLKELAKELESGIKQNSQNNDNLRREIASAIKNIRLTSINVVNHMEKIREIASFWESTGKLNLTKVNKSYLYDRNYLLKMDSDVQFVKESALNLEVDLKGEVDTFFVCCSEDNNSNSKITVPASKDLIDESRYLILQDSLLRSIEIAKHSQLYAPNFCINNSKFISNYAANNNSYNYCINKDYNYSINYTNTSLDNFFPNKVTNPSKSRPLSSKNKSSTFYAPFQKQPTKMSQQLRKLKAEMGDKKYEDLFMRNKGKIVIQREVGVNFGGEDNGRCERYRRYEGYWGNNKSEELYNKSNKNRIILEKEEEEMSSGNKDIKHVEKEEEEPKMRYDEYNKETDHSMSQYLEEKRQEMMEEGK